MTQSKRIGILTSGGDCPGLNAVIRSVVKSATHKYNWEVYGIPYGTEGFLEILAGKRKPEQLLLKDQGYDIPGLIQGLDILQFLSGSVLGSLSKGENLEYADDIIKGYQLLQLDALVVIGGDGSIEILDEIASKAMVQRVNWNSVVVPKTIDNDVPFTERCVGFDTAVNTLTKALYDLTFTAASHDRIMVVESMGRDAGHLALHGGIAGGADIILIPEMTPVADQTVMETICHQLAKLRMGNRKFGLIVVAEGVKIPVPQTQHPDQTIGEYIAREIPTISQRLCQNGNDLFCNLGNVSTRAMILGHLQRAGTPTSGDRLLATTFGREAIELIAKGKYNRMVSWENSQVNNVPLSQVLEAIKKSRTKKRSPSEVDPQGFMVQTARDLGICLGC